MAFTSTQTTAGSLRDTARSLVANFKDELARRRVFIQTKRELNSLSNRELADLGLRRSEITRLAHEAAYGN